MSDEMPRKGKWSGKGMLDIAQEWAARDGRTDARDLSPEDCRKFCDPLLTMAGYVIHQMADETTHPTYVRAACRMKDGRVLTVAVDIKPEGAARQDAINARMKDQRDELLVAVAKFLEFGENWTMECCDKDLGPCTACGPFLRARQKLREAIAKAEGKP